MRTSFKILVSQLLEKEESPCFRTVLNTTANFIFSGVEHKWKITVVEWLNNEITGVLVETLRVAQFVNKFLALYGTRKLITVST
jgi:hypothetical protein